MNFDLFKLHDHQGAETLNCGRHARQGGIAWRPRLVWTPGASAVALAIAGAVAIAPVTNPRPVPSPPVVHVQDVALAGVGQDIYNAVTPAVQYVVGGGSYLVNFVPLIGGPTAAQININYFQLIQPTVAATVNYLAGVVQDPLNIVPTTQAYGVTLHDIGYNYVSAQLRFLGLQPLPPLPPIASTRAHRPPAAGTASPRAGRATGFNRPAKAAAVAKNPHNQQNQRSETRKFATVG